ncbi:ABC transporter substrate-binding protein [Streptomyces sp. NPDC048636]|uniref:sugar ABC transporter substrate-binding protein n=1 Tax=Streptomyces sp. NPDC048636 TaxID=3155762 RepID=UPI00344230D5
MSSSALSRRGLLRAAGIGAVGVAGSGLLSACAPGGGSGSGGDTRAKNFEFTSWSLGEPASKPAIERILNSWESGNSSKISTTTIPYNNFLQELSLKLNGRQIAGAIQLDIAWLAAIAQTGTLADLGAHAEKGGYTPAGLSSGQYRRRQYGLPWTTGAIGLIGNQDLLDRAGIRKAPTTIAQFEDALRSLKELDGVTPYAASTAIAQLGDIFPWLQTFGCPVIKDGKVVIGDDASVDAMTWYKKLYDDKLIAKDVDRNSARALFGRGTVGFYDDAIVGKAAALANAKSPKKLGPAMVPFSRPVLHTGDDPQALLWGHVIVVAKGDGQDAASRFALHTTSDVATTTKYFTSVGLPPATTKGLAAPDIAADTFATQWTRRITRTATPGPFWPYAKNAQILNAVAQQVQAALVGNASPKAAMRTAGEQAARLLED